jgi:uncharacterized protein
VNLDLLLSQLDEHAPLRTSFHHGDLHWQAVAHAGLELAAEVDGCDREIVFLFALFHDAQRENEWDDPGHGARGAKLARRLHGQAFTLPERRLTLLCDACEGHTDVPRSDDPTVGVCFDADRLNLWRVGTVPDPAYLSTGPARSRERISHAATWHGVAYGWETLAERYGLLEDTSRQDEQGTR